MRSTSLPLRPPLYPLLIAVRPTSVAAEGGALEEGARRPSQPRGGAAQLGLDTPRYASPPLPPSLPRRGSDLAPLPQGLLRPPRRTPRRTSTPTAGRRSKGVGALRAAPLTDSSYGAARPKLAPTLVLLPSGTHTSKKSMTTMSRCVSRCCWRAGRAASVTAVCTVALLLRDCSSPFAQGLSASPDQSKRGRDAELTPVTGEQDGTRRREEELPMTPLANFSPDLLEAIETVAEPRATDEVSVLVDDVLCLSNAQAGPTTLRVYAPQNAPQPMNTLSPSGSSDAEPEDESGMCKRTRGGFVISDEEGAEADGGLDGGGEARGVRRIDNEEQSAGALRVHRLPRPHELRIRCKWRPPVPSQSRPFQSRPPQCSLPSRRRSATSRGDRGGRQAIDQRGRPL